MPGGRPGRPPPARPADDAGAGGGPAGGGRLLLVLVLERVRRGRFDPASAAAAPSSAAPAGSAAPSDETGVTATQIHVAFIADVNTPVAPGLFQKSVDAVNAWAKIVNANGGLAGRQVQVDFCDGKLDANATTNCVIKACQNDFAMITQADVLTDISDIDGCKN